MTRAAGYDAVSRPYFRIQRHRQNGGFFDGIQVTNRLTFRGLATTTRRGMTLELPARSSKDGMAKLFLNEPNTFCRLAPLHVFEQLPYLAGSGQFKRSGMLAKNCVKRHTKMLQKVLGFERKEVYLLPS